MKYFKTKVKLVIDLLALIQILVKHYKGKNLFTNDAISLQRGLRPEKPENADPDSRITGASVKLLLLPIQNR
jgi:hypothetical protein